jgi:hypothetical protein
MLPNIDKGKYRSTCSIPPGRMFGCTSDFFSWHNSWYCYRLLAKLYLQQLPSSSGLYWHHLKYCCKIEQLFKPERCVKKRIQAGEFDGPTWKSS